VPAIPKRGVVSGTYVTEKSDYTPGEAGCCTVLVTTKGQRGIKSFHELCTLYKRLNAGFADIVKLLPYSLKRSRFT
jgi:hypothetical protein